MSRVEDRAVYDVPVRLRLIEGDLDRIDAQFERLNQRFDMQDKRLGKIMAACTGILTGLVGGLILLALNLAAK